MINCSVCKISQNRENVSVHRLIDKTVPSLFSFWSRLIPERSFYKCVPVLFVWTRSRCTVNLNEGSHHIQNIFSIPRWVKDTCWKIRWLPEQLLHQTNRSVCLGLFSAADEHRFVGSVIRASWRCARGNWSPTWSSSKLRVLKDWDRRGETPGSSPATASTEPSQ